MIRMELSIKTDYVPSWDVSSGIREFVSNARDAEIQFNAPMTIDHYNNTLRITNEGCVLPRESLLFGHTTKIGVNDMVGRFGEGAKIAALVLTRNGYPVKIRSASEVWVPVIERSDKFNADVLVFQISEGRKQENRVRVEIGNITAEMWQTLKRKFLFLETDPSLDKTRIKTSYGQLLTEPKHSGHIYVKGIFVQKTQNSMGYNFSDCDLDRDRKMVSHYDMGYHMSLIWKEAIVSRPDLLENYFNLFDSQKEDISSVSSYNAYQLPQSISDYAAKKFQDRYGKDAVPVENIEQSSDILHFGKKGIVVSRQLQALLSKTDIGNFDKVKAALRNETTKLYSWHDFLPEEKANLEGSLKLIMDADNRCHFEDVDVVDFRSDDLDGLYIGDTRRVQVAYKHLKDANKVLQILIHEYAHKLSSATDGEKGHISTIEELWMKVVSTMRSANNPNV